MIVNMSKIQVVVSMADKDSLLTELQKYGVLHVVPVAADQAVADEQVAQQFADAQHAYTILNHHQPVVPSSVDLKVSEVVSDVLGNQKVIDECRHKISTNLRTIEHQHMWGDLSLADLDYLKGEGKCPQFLLLPEDADIDFDADFVTTLDGASVGKKIVAVVGAQNLELSDESGIEALHLPEQDNPSLRAENVELKAKKATAKEEINKLASHFDKVAKYVKNMESIHEYSTAANAGLNDPDLYAIQGWVPTDKFDNLAEHMDKKHIHCGMRIVDAKDNEIPPTEISYPEWTKPIKGLFGVLGTLPGYNEPELSKFFMVAFPLFAAMLIGDGGYGLIFMALAFGMREKLVKAAGKEMADLVKIIGIATFIWGVVTGNFFGVTPGSFGLDEAGNPLGFGKLMAIPAIFWKANSDEAVALMTKFCFFIGCIHLILAHLCQAIFMWPDKRAISEIGWCVVLVGMLGLIWSLFYPDNLLMPMRIVGGFILVGLIMVILFTHPAKNPVVRILIGIASSLLPTIGAFGDTMSYIRLMAVGLASYYLALAFNQMGVEMFDSGIFGVIMGCIVIIFGHILNIILAIIAVLAHGVRLNMLEFSGGAGIQWGGYAYEPFGNKK